MLIITFNEVTEVSAFDAIFENIKKDLLWMIVIFTYNMLQYDPSGKLSRILVLANSNSFYSISAKVFTWDDSSKFSTFFC
jgi:hypothetical protein